MTEQEYKSFATRALKENGHRVAQKNMILIKRATDHVILLNKENGKKYGCVLCGDGTTDVTILSEQNIKSA